MNFQILKKLTRLVGRCKGYDSINIFAKFITEDQEGFSQKFYFECGSSTWCHGFYSSAEFLIQSKDIKGKKPFEIDVKSMIAFRENG